MLNRAAIFLLTAIACPAAWTFNWDNAVDQMGMPRGIFTNTPVPIWETNTTYSLTNDEGVKVFNLGTLYFVDGAAADDTGNGLSLATPKKLIGSGLTLAGSNVNATIIVRGAHDAFNGIYTNAAAWSLNAYAGQGDTNRLMIVGYGQERPLIAVPSGNAFGIHTGGPVESYITLQRLCITNCGSTGIYLGVDTTAVKVAGHFNCIDLHVTTIGWPDQVTDGAIYYMNVDDGWIFHCLAEYISGHGLKFGDGSSDGTLEWSVARYIGWWPGRTQFYSRNVAIDLPSDRDTSSNNVVRYNTASGCIFYGMQLRLQHGFNVHHNDVSDFGRGLDMTGDYGGTTPHGILLLCDSPANGTVSDNKVHDAYSANSDGMMVVSQMAGSGTVHIRNNLIYGSVSGVALQVGLAGSNNDATNRIYNNTLIGSNANATLIFKATVTGSNFLQNNIIVNLGSGPSGDTPSHSVFPLHQNNIYYHPNGSAADWGENGTGESVADPAFLTGYTIGTNSPAYGAGANLSTIFTTDLNSYTRPAAWSIGSYEWVDTGPPPPRTMSVSGTLRIGKIVTP